MKILLLLTTIFFVQSLFSQKVTIEYLYKPTEYLRDSSDFELKPCNLYSVTDSRFVQPIKPVSEEFGYDKGYSKSVFTFLINDTTPFLIGDGFGHQILLLPEDDTVRIKIKGVIEHPPYYSKDSFLVPWHLEYEYQSKRNKVIGIYDSIDIITGSIFWDKVQLEKAGYNYDTLYNLCLNKYQKRIAFINGYCERHHIANSLKNLVLQEAKCGLIINLLFVFKQPDIPSNILEKLPKHLKQTLDSFEPDNVRFFRKTNLYTKAVSDYSLLYMPYKYANENHDDLIRNYEIAKSKFEGEIKDFLIANHLKYYLKNKSNIYDSLLTDYKAFSKDTNSIIFLDSVRNIFKVKQKAPFSQILETEVLNIKSEKKSLNKVIENKPTIIDCWASWCKPCIEEMPDGKKIKDKYKGKISYIYLSIDKSKTDWLKGSKKFNLENSYLLINNANNKFSDYFDISSIPRYIILDKNKNVYSANAPRPSQIAKWENILKELLK
jgi:thiol-disulfide isomerase/thioredoxin